MARTPGTEAAGFTDLLLQTIQCSIYSLLIKICKCERPAEKPGVQDLIPFTGISGTDAWQSQDSYLWAGTPIFLGNLVSVSPSWTLKFSFFPRTIATLNGLTTTETVTAETGDGFKS